jgi:outer membrane protein TolC
MGQGLIEKTLFMVYLVAFASFCILPGTAEAQPAGPDAPPQAAMEIMDTAEGGGVFSLERCIKIALAKNPEIAAAQWDISAAGSRLDAARPAFWPQASIESGFQHYVDSQRLIAARFNGELGVFDNDVLRGDLVAKMTLYSGGRTTSEAGAAEKLSEAEKKKFIRTRDELIYSVAGVFYSILGQQKIIASLEFSRNALAEHLIRVSQLYDVQKAAKVDILRTEVRLTNLKQNIIKEENTLAGQKRLLFNLMGLDADPEAALFDQKLEPVETPIDKIRLVETAMKNRPDYQSARDKVEAQGLRVEAAKAGHLPSLNLVASYGMRNAPSPEDVGTYTPKNAPTPAYVGKERESTEDAGFVGIVLTIPLFEGGRVSAKVSEEMATLAAARERLKKLELQIRQETETAALDVISNKARIRATEKSIEQAKESFRIESMKYDLGKGSITDVLDAASAQLEAETTYYRAVIDYHISVAKLNLARGGTI